MRQVIEPLSAVIVREGSLLAASLVLPKENPRCLPGSTAGAQIDTLHQQGMYVLIHRCTATKIKFWTGSRQKLRAF
jgi:hypothetical protein